MPAELAELVFIPQVAGLVSLDLCPPPVTAGFGEAEIWAILMAVPEAAVDEDDGAVFRQDEVGFSGEGFVIRPVDGESVAEAVEHRSQGELRLGVASPDAGHDFGAFFWGEDVHGETQDLETQDSSEDASGGASRRASAGSSAGWDPGRCPGLSSFAPLGLEAPLEGAAVAGKCGQCFKRASFQLTPWDHRGGIDFELVHGAAADAGS